MAPPPRTELLPLVGRAQDLEEVAREPPTRSLQRRALSKPRVAARSSRAVQIGLPVAVLVAVGIAVCLLVAGGPARARPWGGKAGVVKLDKECEESTGRHLSDGDPCKITSEAAMKEFDSEFKEFEQAMKKQEKHSSLRAKVTVNVAHECSAGGLNNCNETKCCVTAGEQCYEQTSGYAQCRPSCSPGPDPTHWDGAAWSCNALGERARGEWPCTAAGEDCSASQCCGDAGLQCYAKNATFATCKSDCYGGAPDMADVDSKKWTCKELGVRAPGLMGWVSQQCSGWGENCASTRCCKEAGAQCYEQSGSPDGADIYWATCKSSCTAGKDPARPWEQGWSCGALGGRTPPPPAKGHRVSEWAADYCSSDAESCDGSRCCLGVDRQCYRKSGTFAQCRLWCTPGGEKDPSNETWACHVLSQRSWGLATKGFPSIFCFSLIRTSGYEAEILRAQHERQIGIFECDSAAVLAADGVLDFGDMKSLKVEMAEITTSLDHTAGNAKLFVNVWKVIVEDGRWAHYAWTVKVDPDAVIMPSRIRDHMAGHTGEKAFVVNCDLFPNSPNFPMMYGAVEIYSNTAMHAYAERSGECIKDMGMMLPKWGEDYYMTHCLDHIGVGRIADFGSLGDQLCMGANCADVGVASFHPFKSLASWTRCHDAAVNASLRADARRP